MSDTNPKLLEALHTCATALADLAGHPAFADDAEEFNEGGVGYIASHATRNAIAAAEQPEAEANKALALAAPYMLAALKAVKECVFGEAGDREKALAVEQADDAIEKAEGTR